MIERVARARLERLAGMFPVVMVTGPRQAGKTTLCRAAFPDRPWVSLEDPDTRDHAVRDPRGLLARYPRGAVLDEVQRAPVLPSYLQGMVDADPTPGRFILTGSQHFGLVQSVSQSLAGRAAVLELLPLSWDEVLRFERHPVDLWEALWTGGYPAILDRGLDPAEWLGAYGSLYVERDVRQVLNVGDLQAFRTFVRLVAGRSGQLLNLSSLGGDAGISHNTARAWLGVLEAGYLVARVPPLVATLRKRLVRTPKVVLLDSGLLCHLLGIREPGQIEVHPLRGAVFESWVASEVLKHIRHRGLGADVAFYRDRSGREVDLVVTAGRTALAIEVKSGSTIGSDFFRPFQVFNSGFPSSPVARDLRRVLVYGGPDRTTREGVEVVGWQHLQECLRETLT